MEMGITEIEPGVMAVTLDGRLDAAGAGAIDLRFSAVAGGSRSLLVDMAGVTFMASIGLRTLLSGARTVTRRGGRFFLVSPTGEVESVLVVSGVTDMMPIAASRAEALAAIRPAP